MTKPIAIALVLLAAVVVGSSCGPAASVLTFEQRACPDSLPAAHVTCGVVRVPENYDVPSGRQIALNVIVLRAIETSQKEVAEFDLEGGPGYAATKGAMFYLREGAAFRRTRDVVLADQRGTGGSGALRCPEIEAHDRQRPSLPIYPAELVKACAAALSAAHDLTQYTTAASARDIDAVRRALGYERFALFGLSYGTTLAFRYIADFGAHVHSAVLLGPVPADRTPPRHHATVAAQALERVFADCAAEPACGAAFPDIKADLAAAMARLDRQGGFARAIFMEKIRTLMYTPGGVREVPFFIHAAAKGDFEAFDVATRPGPGGDFADGLYLAITCSETLARIDVAAAVAQSSVSPFAAYRLERQRDACAVWPAAKPDEKLFALAVSDAPVVLLTGAFDPVAAPDWAVDAAKQFPKGKLVVIPYGAHVLDGLSGTDTCFDAQVLAVMDSGRAGAFDAACVDAMKPPPYRTR